jgi:ubiquinone/menaquinone biosynthesis C-methylase UbiE
MAEPSQCGVPTNKIPFDTEAHFERVASTYESSAVVMKDIASQLLHLPPQVTSSSVIHDNACGPGIVTGQILSLPEFADGKQLPKIHATDISAAMIRALMSRAVRDAWPHGVVKAEAMDSMDLCGIKSETFTHSYMAAAIFIVPDATEALKEVWRTLKPGGVAFVTSFEDLEYMEIFRDANKAVRSEAAPLKSPFSEEWSTEKKLRDVVEGGGFESGNVEIRRITAGMRGADLASPGGAAFVETFAKGISKEWAEEEQVAFERKVKEDLQSERVKNRTYVFKVMVAVAKK